MNFTGQEFFERILCMRLTMFGVGGLNSLSSCHRGKKPIEKIRLTIFSFIKHKVNLKGLPLLREQALSHKVCMLWEFYRNPADDSGAKVSSVICDG